jgi:hypothetical protein
LNIFVIYKKITTLFLKDLQNTKIPKLTTNIRI